MIRYKCLYLSLLFSFAAFNVYAQNNNDCNSALLVSNTDDFCDIFSNDNATDSGLMDDGCWTTDPIKDVWFRFTARRQGMLIRVFAGRDIDDGFGSARIQVFSGMCGELVDLECFPLISNTNLDEFELYLNTLEIGEEYFIRVDSKSEARGNFELCLNSFNPLIQPFQDCSDARTLCNTEGFSVNFLSGGGNDNNELEDSCLDPRVNGNGFGPSETGSIWYVFECRNPGDLVFTLTSNRDLNRGVDSNPEEDLDFIVYELPSGINSNGPNDCSNKQLLRCMASGITVGGSDEFNRPCLGETGLAIGETDILEEAGCSGNGDNNFLAPIPMTTGTAYALVVNNFSQSNFGFTLDFDGTTGTFVGPEADFTTDKTQLFCDQEITFTDQSLPGVDGQLTYLWNFGEGAFPNERERSPGPHTITYESFGEKFISLQVTSGDGCVSVDVLDLDVGTCCDPAFATLDYESEPFTIDCPGDQNGVFQLVEIDEGHGGVLFSFDEGDNFNAQSSIDMLAAGDYQAIARDKKGCEDPIDLVITERPGLTISAEASPNVLGLGETTTLTATIDGDLTNVTTLWEPSQFVDCEDCLTTVASPVIPTEFIITAENEFGCTFPASVFVEIDPNYEGQVYQPNAITPNGDNINDYFKLYGSLAVAGIDQLKVFNRWGDLMYNGTNLPIEEDFAIGWDGTFNGVPLNPDVFTWVAEVRFIDDNVIVFKGTVTLIINER
jgi:gliding motility-associated-like protein